MQQNEESSGVSSRDYILAVCIIIEAIALYFLLVNKASFIGLLIPIAVSIASVVIASMAFRDFFRQHK